MIIVAVVAVVIIVPNSKDPTQPKLDVLGTVLSTIGLVALLYGIIEGPTAGGAIRSSSRASSSPSCC